MKKNPVILVIFVFLIIEAAFVINTNFSVQTINLASHVIALSVSILLVLFFQYYINKYNRLENFHKKILNAITDAVFIINSKGKILYFNEQVKNILSYEPYQINRQNFIKFIPEKEKIRYQRKLIEVFFEKQISNFETYMIHANGSLINVEISGKVMEYKGLNVVLGTIRDITDRKKAEQALIESGKNFRLLFENAPFGIYTATPEGDIIDINPQALKILGSPSAEATKKINILQFQPLIENGYADVYKKCLKTGKKSFFDRKYRSMWGKEAIILSQIIPLKDESGNIVKIYTVMQDISAKKHAEQKLKEQNVEYAKLVKEYQNQNKQLIEAKLKADESNRLKSEFLTRMSHEIRTPMNAIIGFSEVLQMQLTNEKYLSYVDKIMSSGNNLLELINSILDLSKMEAKQIEIKPEKTNIRKIFDEISLIFSGISKHQQTPVYKEINNQLPEILLMDAFRLKQILMNLVGNALKFTEKGKIILKADFEKAEKANTINLIFEVIDTGIGIPEEEFQTIFQSFTQLNMQSDKIYGGTGLGLAITRQLVEIMNGSISVKSKVGAGSTFTVIFNEVDVLPASEQEI